MPHESQGYACVAEVPWLSMPRLPRARMSPFDETSRTGAARTREQRVDFSFTEEQLMIQDVARRIAQEKIAPSAEHHDSTGEFPLENIRLLEKSGGKSGDYIAEE